MSATEWGLTERFAQFGDDLGGSVLQAIEYSDEARADVVGARAARGRILAAEAKQVVSLIEGQVQSLRDRGDHLPCSPNPAARSR